jgi:biotin carboxyl carrier protein
LSKYKLNIDGQNFDVEIISEKNNSYEVMVNGELIEVIKEPSLNKANQTSSVNRISQTKNENTVKKLNPIQNIDKKNESPNPNNSEDSIKALMPGKVLKILVSQGEKIKSGTPLLVIESMKMENVISSNKNGEVKKIYVSVDDNVQYDQALIDIK